jgi:hypothetical protein
MRPAPGFADKASSVGVIDEHHGVVLLCQRDNLAQLGHIAVHGEHAVGDDHTEPFVLVFLQLLLKVPHIRMLVSILHRFAQTHSVHNGGVNEAISDHHVLFI